MSEVTAGAAAQPDTAVSTALPEPAAVVDEDVDEDADDSNALPLDETSGPAGAEPPAELAASAAAGGEEMERTASAAQTTAFKAWLAALAIEPAAAEAMKQEGLDTLEDLQEVLDDPEILESFSLKTFDRLRLLRMAPAAVAACGAGMDPAEGAVASMVVPGCETDAAGWLGSCGLGELSELLLSQGLMVKSAPCLVSPLHSWLRRRLHPVFSTAFCSLRTSRTRPSCI